MNDYINYGWAAIGLIIALFGMGIWKKRFKGIVKKIDTSGFSNAEGFCEFFGKSVIFLGVVTLASSVICYRSPSYLPVALSLNGLTVIYFVLESFHLKKQYA